MPTLPDYEAYNGIPLPVPLLDQTPCVGINSHCGLVLDGGGKAANQLALAADWFARGNGRLGARQRFDVVFKPTVGSFYDTNWLPSHIARIPLADWNLMVAIWQSQGFTIVTSQVDQTWLADVWAADPVTAPCPYSSFIDWAQKIVYINRYVLDVRQQAARDWVVSSALSFRTRVNVDLSLPIDLWESALKSWFWRYPQEYHRDPFAGFGAGALTDTPFGLGEWEDGMQDTFRALFAESFDFIVNDIPREGDTNGDWLDTDVFNALLGDWKPVPHPEPTGDVVRPPIKPNPRRPGGKGGPKKDTINAGPRKT